MPSMKEKCIDWVISIAKHGDSWWMPLLLIVVSCINSLTGGMFVWCIGVLQSMLFTLVSMRKRVGIILAPVCLTIGSSLAIYTYIQLMKTSGADALMEKAGIKDSKMLEKASAWSADYGACGLLAIQISPIPVPSAVIVIAGMLAKINEWTIFTVLVIGKFCMLLVSCLAVGFVTEGMTAEEYLRQQFKGEAPADATKDAAKDEQKDAVEKKGE